MRNRLLAARCLGSVLTTWHEDMMGRVYSLLNIPAAVLFHCCLPCRLLAGLETQSHLRVFNRDLGVLMIVVRRVTGHDIDLYREVRLASLMDSPGAFSSTYEEANERPPGQWGEYLRSCAKGAERAIFIALHDGLPVGVTAIGREDEQPQSAQLFQVWVAPSYRGTTVGEDLFNCVRDWAIANDYAELLAEVFADNQRAVGFYRKMGFVTGYATAIENRSSLMLRLSI